MYMGLIDRETERDNSFSKRVYGNSEKNEQKIKSLPDGMSWKFK